MRHCWSWFVLATLWAGMNLPGARAAEFADTRMLSMPAVSHKHIAFVYAEDLWIADLDGRNPRRLTSDLGIESYPCFSPDGQTLAFSAQYDGNVDVFIMPITGGTPTRLTWHPSADIVRGWTPDGSAILFSSPRNVFSSRHTQLFLVPKTGGMPTQLPIPYGFEACFSPDGQYIAYTPVRDATPQWKNYRGGTHSRIWIYRRSDHHVEEIPQPAGRCNDLDPQWVGDTIYFRSDRHGDYNLFAYDVKTKQIRQLTHHKDFPVLDLAANGGQLVYEQAGRLVRYDLGAQASAPIAVQIATDRPEARARYLKGAKYVQGASVSPSGARAALEFRGEIVTVPAEKGDPRYLTQTPGAHERDPAWSPDGKTIAYFSDASGEYELHLTPQDGKGATRKIKLEGAGFYSNLTWSRDSKKLAYSDNSQSIYWLDAATGKAVKVAQAKYGRARGLNLSSWSPDSKWLAYAQDTAAQISQIWLYSLEQNKSFPITDGLSEATEPVFDASGKYLYFLSSNDTGMTKHGFALSSSDTRPPRWTINLALLRKNLPSPFVRESDEEKGESARPEGPTPPPGSGPGGPPGSPPTPPTPPTPPAPGSGPSAPPAREGAPKGEMTDEMRERIRSAMEARRGAPREPFTIDFAGLDQRILALPVPPGNYANLQAGSANQLFYLARMDSGARGAPGAGPMGSVLHRYNLESRKDDVVQPAVISYELTPDGRKMLYATSPTTWIIGSTGGGGGGAPASLAALMSARSGRPSGEAGGGDASPGRLNLDAIEVKVDPQAEWKQIFNEAWRINRDFFYAPNMHGADWVAVRKKYEPFLPHLTSNADLYRVIRWMLSELAVGHSYTTPGERNLEKKTVPGGLLGADYEIANGRYRFKKIYGGLNWTPDLRSPLTAPGVNVKEGDYLLAVRGIDLRPPTEIYSLFENTAGKSIEITVGPNPEGKDSRTVTVEPLASEAALRNRDWIEGNMRKVHQATGGRVAYVYLPDTAGGGLQSFKRYFFPQVDKDALIVDERFNSGGQIADYYIDILRRPYTCNWAPRHGEDWRSPSAAIHGPKVMLIDEGAGSGGDLLPWMFRKYKLGPLVGKRTWGGLVGIGGYPSLLDGGTVTAPSFAFWSPEEGWAIENEGVPPDIEVEQWPADVIAGKDPQLEKAIAIVLEELKKNPVKKPARPPFPERANKTTN